MRDRHLLLRRAGTSNAAVLFVAALVASLLPVLVVSVVTPAAAAEPTNGMIAYAAEPACPQGGCDLREQRIFAQDGNTDATDRVWLTQTSTATDAQEWAPRWSPDGSTAVFYRGYGSFELGQVKADGTGGKAFGYNGHSTQHPDWSPDGQWVYYAVDAVLWRVRPDGTGTEKVPWPSTMYYSGGAFAFAPDGRIVFYGARYENGGYHSGGVYIMDLASGTATLLVADTDATRVFHGSMRFDVSSTGVLLYHEYDRSTSLTGCVEASRAPYVLYTVPISGGTPTRLSPPSTFAGPDYLSAGWSPDGTQIVANSETYTCTDRGTPGLTEFDTVILTSTGGFVRSLGIETFAGADWQPCTAGTVTCAAPGGGSQPTPTPTPTPTSSTGASPSPSPTPTPSATPTGAPSPSPTPTQPGEPEPDVAPPPTRSDGVTRLAGTDRYSTGAAVSRGSFPGTANDVFVVTGANWPDALSAGPAAARVNGPVLPVQTSAIPATISAEIDRLQPLRAWVIGGPSVITDSVVSNLQGRGLQVTRVSGTDRYSTAAAVAARFFPDAAGAYYASGAGYADALGGGAAAAERDWPLLLTAKDSVPAATPVLGAERIVLGGPAAVSESVRSQLGARRVAGTDRYGTAAAIALDAFSTAEVIYLATGLNFPDALAGTPAAARDDAPLLLAAKGCVTLATRDAVQELGATSRVILGGTAVVSDSAANLTLC